jgi:hypothetical protein
MERSSYLPKQGLSAGSWLEVSMSPTIAECQEHARQCEWYAARTNDEKDRKFLLRMAKHWTKLAAEKEREVRASARDAA